jgi:hypothetical protein
MPLAFRYRKGTDMRSPKPLWIVLLAGVFTCSTQPELPRPADTTVTDSTPAEQQTIGLPANAPSLPMVLPAPCEYCNAGAVVCRELVVRASDESAAAPVARLQRGDTVLLLDGRTHVHFPEILVFQDTLDYSVVAERVEGGARRDMRSIVFAPGDTVLVFSYGFEGSDGDWWYKGRMWRSYNSWMWEVNLPRVSRHRDKVAAKTLHTWDAVSWLKVRAKNECEGWVENKNHALVFGNHWEPETPPCPGG